MTLTPLLALLTEVGNIIMKIEKHAILDTNTNLPIDPLNLVKQALETEPSPKTEEELEEAFRKILQGQQIDAVIEYSSILAELRLNDPIYEPDPEWRVKNKNE